jgi:hypothetical protein
MGARVNYVLIEGEVISVYYSKWGAQSVPTVVIDGPEATLAYIRDEGPTTESLMDDIWAEGGILLDMDRHALLFFGGENIMFSPPWQRIFLRMVRHVWQGWSIAWAGRGIIDLASYPGVAEFLRIDPSSLIKRNERVIDQPFAEAKIRNPHEKPWAYTVITVTWEDGRVCDYTFDSALDGYLLLGPGLLDVLRERETDNLPREEPDDDSLPREGTYIDTVSQAMWVWHYRPVYSAKPERIAQIWSGWNVNEHFEGLGRQVALSGRSPALVAAPYEQVEAELVGDLMHGHNDDEDAKSQALAQELAKQPQLDSATRAFILNEIANPTPSPPRPPAAERRAYLTALLQQALQEDAGDPVSE